LIKTIPAAPAGSRLRFLDSLRLLALLGVLLYHFNLLPGGYLGVDVFFVLSGFLLARSFCLTYQAKGTVALGDFLKRRCKRLFLPLLLAVLASLPAALLISKDFTAKIGRQVSAGLGFVENIYEIRTGGNYADAAMPRLYVHLWYIAVEVQLLLLLALCAALLAWVLRQGAGRADVNPRGFRQGLGLLSAIGAIASFAAFFYTVRTNPENVSAAYYGTFTHAYPFYLGVWFAASGGLPDLQGSYPKIYKFQRGMGIALTLSALTGFGVLCAAVDFSDPSFAWGGAAAAVLALVFLQGTRCLQIGFPALREPRAVSFAAALSYPIYLAHWPLWIVFSRLWGNTLGALSAVFVSILFAIWADWVTGNGLTVQKESHHIAKQVLSGLLTLACATGAVAVFLRAPQQTELNENMMAEYISQDLAAMETLSANATKLNAAPVKLRTDKGTLFNGLSADMLALLVPAEIRSGQPMKVDASILGGVTIIGDSVTMGGKEHLLKTIDNLDADTVGMRKPSEGLKVLTDKQNAGTLREYVVIALGTNGETNWQENIDNIIKTLKPGHRLIFVTPFDKRADADWWSSKICAYYRTLPEKYSFVTCADWAAAISSQVDLLMEDGIHIAYREKAIQIYTNAIVGAINEASKKPAKGS
jgi:peptidoglycan/LPS O-acetylase OafA/YrhL